MIGGTAAAAAVAWGASDFCGGKASQRADAWAVVVVSQLASVPLLAGWLWSTSPDWPARTDMAWAFAAGLTGAVGLVLLYHALAGGAMSVVAPVTAVTSAAVPVAVGLAFDRIPGATVVAGIGFAVLAIGLIALVPNSGPVRVSAGTVLVALAAGCGFGLFYTLLANIGPGAGLWPLAAVRAASLVVGGTLCWYVGSTLRLTGASLRWALGAGVLDIVANALYLAATYTGLLSVVAPTASLYPVITVLLALVVDRELLRPTQYGAIGLAALSLVLIHAGG
ncbi:MAG TPA: DMT family transporter [Micromonosporaceae bacterium]